jgi:hypothetical protein
METREKHLQWCKDKALEILDDSGNSGEAYASFCSDMSKHPDTEKHSAIELGMMMLIGGHLNSKYEMKKFIEGFN